MPILNTPRGRFFYRQTSGQSPTLIFLAGNLGTSRWWQATMERLPAGWRGIALDPLGSGDSERSTDLQRFTVAELAADLAACVQALDVERLHLIAHSTATAVAIQYALGAQQQVTTLTLVGPVPVGGAQTPPEAYPLLEQLPADPELRHKALQASMPTLDPQSPDFRQFDDDLAQIDATSLVGIARGLDRWQPDAALRGLRMPVLLVRGAEDIMLDAAAAQQTLLATPAANNLEILRGAGHSPMIERPQSFVEVLVRFISEERDAYDELKARA